MTEATIGVIGGSGLYQMPGLSDIRTVEVDTPFGAPSDHYVIGTLEGRRVAFLPRHGRGHRYSPSEINFRANVMGFRMLGVEWLISVSAVGSMKEQIRPGDMVVPDQFFDRTRSRPSSFFGGGCVGHIAFGDPVCPVLFGILVDSCLQAGATVHRGGTYLCMEGPQFSTRAESFIYRQWGVDVIGMTNLPEAKLAREAELHYATLAMSTDYDCWHDSHADVTVEQILKILMENVRKAQEIIRRAVALIPPPGGECGCAQALATAVITDPAVIPPETKERLRPLLGKYWDKT
jgi:5'-methylthioadenosine phosphorylase